jgi:hypothetical protein
MWHFFDPIDQNIGDRPNRRLRSTLDGTLLVRPRSRLLTFGDRAFSSAAPEAMEPTSKQGERNYQYLGLQGEP